MMSLPPSPPKPAPVESTQRQPTASVRITSAQLFAGATEVQIEHFGAVYRLKQTALGKLILTK